MPHEAIYPWFNSGLINEEGELVLCGSAVFPNGVGVYHKRLIHLKLSPELDSLIFQEIIGPNSLFPTSFDLIQLTNGEYVINTFSWYENIISGQAINSSLLLTVLDSTLLPTYSLRPAVSDIIDPQIGIQTYQDSLILCSAVIFNNPTGGNGSVLDFTVMILNEEFQLVDSVELGLSYNGENM